MAPCGNVRRAKTERLSLNLDEQPLLSFSPPPSLLVSLGFLCFQGNYVKFNYSTYIIKQLSSLVKTASVEGVGSQKIQAISLT